MIDTYVQNLIISYNQAMVTGDCSKVQRILLKAILDPCRSQPRNSNAYAKAFCPWILYYGGTCDKGFVIGLAFRLRYSTK